MCFRIPGLAAASLERSAGSQLCPLLGPRSTELLPAHRLCSRLTHPTHSVSGLSLCRAGWPPAFPSPPLVGFIQKDDKTWKRTSHEIVRDDGSSGESPTHIPDSFVSLLCLWLLFGLDSPMPPAPALEAHPWRGAMGGRARGNQGLQKSQVFPTAAHCGKHLTWGDFLKP